MKWVGIYNFSAGFYIETSFNICYNFDMIVQCIER